ncbi:hypothetical protein ENHY17A_30017 [Moraxellaceae bacterium 17A]|nr:hypothetical protein ENHY17A_30017 [Moraxellaceae bacterium 17A]
MPCIYQFSKWARWWAKYDGDFFRFYFVTTTVAMADVDYRSFIGIMRGQFFKCGDLSHAVNDGAAVEERMPAIAPSRNRY